MSRERQRAELIIQSAAEGLLTADRRRRVLSLNPAAEELTGWDADQAVGRFCGEVLNCTGKDNPCDTHCPLTEALRQCQPSHVERRVIRGPSGMERVISLSAAPLIGPDEHPEGAVVLFHDVTERDELDRMQQEFVAAVSHQLGSSLASMSTAVEMLQENGADHKRRQECLDTVAAQTEKLRAFADGMLALFRLETRELNLQPQPLPVGFLIERAVQDWRAATDGHRLAVRTPDRAVWLAADEDAVRSVLDNLIDNAVKYAPPDTQVEIGARQSDDGCAAISVEDEGPGIAPEHQRRIFERFYRVDGTDAQHVYGHGLGLHIARRLIEAMGGEIWVESGKGPGSRFVFTLPLQPAKEDWRE